MKTTLALVIFLLLNTIIIIAQHPSVGGYNVYYGHLHNHTGYSDGEGNPREAFDYARHQAGLDFLGIADHVETLSSREWSRMKDAAKERTENGKFVAFHGFEWSSSRYGHVAVINGQHRIGSGLFGITKSFSRFIREVNEQNCVAFFNHPGREDGWDHEFDHFDNKVSEKFVGIELWNKNSGFDRYYYNDGYHGNDGGKGFFDEAIARGWKIGASGSEDNHGDNWGNMNYYRLAILSNELTKEALYSALQQRRFFSTLDKNMAMSFKVNGNEMGSLINSGKHNIRIELKDGDGEAFTKVELLKNFIVVKTWNINEIQPLLTYEDNGNVNDYYYIRCKQADGDEAISSPVFVTNSQKNASIEEVSSETLKLTELEKDNKPLVEEKISKEINFIVSPNPAKGKAVKVQVEQLTDELKLMVVDMNGKVVVNRVVNESITTLPILKPGIYLVKVFNRTSTKTEKVIIR